MEFPDLLLSECRWVVRPRWSGKVAKQPSSAYESRPFDYETPPGFTDGTEHSWKWRWQCEPVLAPFAVAKSFLDRHGNDYEGLAFVVHHFRDIRPKTRIVGVDFDKCIKDGELDPVVEEYVKWFDSYTSLSRSGTGLHVIIEVTDCPGFRNQTKVPVGKSKVDILCCNPIALTGNVFGEFKQVRQIPWEEFHALPFFIYKIPQDLDETRPEWWSADPIDDVLPHHEYLIPQMQIAEAIEGQGGSQVLYAAACELARHGVVGREAEPLLRCVPATPPFSAKEIRRTIECAYMDVVGCEQFETAGVENEFEVLDDSHDEKSARYGFEPIPVHELAVRDVRVEWLVEGAFTAEGSLFIGGREKCFKTAIGVDLLLSLATKTPFLGQFAVPKTKRSVIFTAEIGIARAKTLIQSICHAKGVSMSAVHGMDVVESVPSFAMNPRTGEYDALTKAGLDGLSRYFHEVKPDIALFDPLYFAMGGAAVGDMYEIGRVLKNISQLCKKYKVQPIFAHHARKGGGGEKEFKPMELGDLYGSGVSAFARQWILLAHAEPFYNGVAVLHAKIEGSSQGSRGLWKITIDEGQPDDIMERQWDVQIEESDGQRSIPEQEIVEAFQAMDDGSAGGYRALRSQLADYWGIETSEVAGVLNKLMKDKRVTMKGKNEFILKGDE